MSKGKSQVSDSFKKFQQKKHNAFDKARKAENTLGGIPMPIDTNFEAQFVGVTADIDDKGRAFVKMDLVVTTPENFTGKKVIGYWMLFDSEKATEADRMAWMLNDLENMGLPREVRETHDDFVSDVLGWFENNTPIVKGRVVKDAQANDGKRIRWSKSATEEHAASTTNDMIGAPIKDVPTNKEPFDAGNIVVGMKVNYNGGEWLVDEIVGENYVNLKSPRTGKIQSEVSVADLEPITKK